MGKRIELHSGFEGWDRKEKRYENQKQKTQKKNGKIRTAHFYFNHNNNNNDDIYKKCGEDELGSGVKGNNESWLLLHHKQMATKLKKK